MAIEPIPIPLPPIRVPGGGGLPIPLPPGGGGTPPGSGGIGGAGSAEAGAIATGDAAMAAAIGGLGLALGGVLADMMNKLFAFIDRLANSVLNSIWYTSAGLVGMVMMIAGVHLIRGHTSTLSLPGLLRFAA